ncbi:hypothetical protein JYU16_01360 [bacterium AH-315-M05]|nr:hypothetical protein [bacterium AH-315-M05]
MKSSISTIASALILIYWGISSGFAQSIPEFNSDAEKQMWIKNHPAEYQLLLDQSKANIPEKQPAQTKTTVKSSTISADDDIKALKEEIDANKNNPDYDKGLASKKLQQATRIQPQSIENKQVEPSKTQRSAVIDPTFPVFVNTGNPEADNENYRIAKEEWISNYPEKYKQLQQQRPLPNDETPEQIRAREKSKQAIVPNK